MTPPAPHPLRCETCDNPHNSNIRGSGLFECMGEELPRTTPILTAKRGCASHSSAATSAEQVLTEFANLVNDGWNHSKISAEVYVNLIDGIRELRAEARR